jgi:threonine dehydratase
VFLSPYDDAHVIAGQASCFAEVAEQLDGPATVLVPVGGGGLLAGTAMLAAREGRFTVVGVEAAASRAVSTAVTAGTISPVPVAPTLADGLAGNLEPGSVTPGLASDHGVSTFLAVDEPAIEEAMRYLARRCGLVVEGSGAVGVAALLTGAFVPTGRTVVLLTGRNVAAPVLARVLAWE